jgi:hypothetical protein
MPSDVAATAVERDLRQKVQELERELSEANRREAATAKILQVISSSPADIQQVFDTIARSAAQVCEAIDVMVLRVDGDVLRLVAHHGRLAMSRCTVERWVVGPLSTGA